MEDICAGIVLFNPNIIRLKLNIESVSKQIKKIVLIDNDSQNKFELMKLLEQYDNVIVIRNKQNLGIAKALNQIIEFAHNNGYPWALLLDQDSIVSEHLVEKYRFYIKNKDIAIICPQIIDLNLPKMQKVCIEEINDSTSVITSGSCVCVDDCIMLGKFDERFFIDFVDTEYNERCLRNGKKILKVNDALLYHEVGSMMEKSFFGLKIYCSNHNPMRRYYMVRNRLFFRYKYFGTIGYLKEFTRLLLGTFKIVLFEDMKLAKIKAFIKGVLDSNKIVSPDSIGEKKTNTKISIILPAAFGTGGIKVLYEYGRRISNRGNKVTFYVPLIAYNMHKGNRLVDFLKQVYATLYLLIEYYIKGRAKTIRMEEQADIKFVFRIDNNHLDNAEVVIASAWVTAFDVSRLSCEKGRKVYFIQGYEVWDNKKLGLQSYSLPLQKIVIAEWIKAKLVSDCKCEVDEISVVNNGIDVDKFNNHNKVYRDNKNLKCLMLDHKLQRKGVKQGIEAFKKAKELLPDISLIMFGMSKSSSVPKGVCYYQDPTQETLIELYREADVFIFPSLEEGWGLTPLEAMACKCAVVGTKVGCMLDIGRNGENVMLSDPGDIDGMVNNLVQVLSNIELRKKLSEEGYITAKKLNWERATELLIKTLQIHN